MMWLNIMPPVILHPLSDFIDCNCAVSNSSASYYYEGFCPQSGELLRLPRTPMAEAIATGLMQYLANHNCYSHEGKMYGILLVELPNGEQRVLKAFSGLLNGQSSIEGWVPPIPGRDQVALEEACTLAELEAIKQELITLKQLPPRQQYETLSREFEQQLQQMSDRHRDGKHQRHEQRQVLCETLTGETLTLALEQLNEESRRHGIERRQLKRQQNVVLQPLKQQIEAANQRIRELKQQRKTLSRQLQAQMYAAYSLTNFSGQSLSLQQLMPGGWMPTGTGDCCAPKLLHYAAIQGLKPLAMAEFWWGPSSADRDKVQGNFYGACAERCQPLMGFLLSGLLKWRPNPPASGTCFQSVPLESDPPKSPLKRGTLTEFSPLNKGGWGGSPRLRTHPTREGGVIAIGFDAYSFLAPPLTRGAGGVWDVTLKKPIGITSPSFTRREVTSELRQPEQTLPIVYQDEWLIAVNKPAGLLSVPGRYRDTFDSVLSRLRHLLPEGMALMAVHRLDQETSGILLLARDRQTYCQLSQQFQQRQVHKVYEAVLSGCVTTEQGAIKLPLWGNPENRPYQKVDWQHGKPSFTHFQVIAREGDSTRVEFIPLTGRTHQLRVHAADSRGLGVPILGDRLYGCRAVASRLHLHARELRFLHPQSGQTLHLQVKTPF
ncbi:RluA family pseudouridine synthase [Allocoleopsis sp.]|uniref:RluA family pseudouridine synthase n=1 Tax=Allocoleopsis sp. TaxID=3088169 RepID=UPI002FCF074C